MWTFSMPASTNSSLPLWKMSRWLSIFCSSVSPSTCTHQSPSTTPWLKRGEWDLVDEDFELDVGIDFVGLGDVLDEALEGLMIVVLGVDDEYQGSCTPLSSQDRRLWGKGIPQRLKVLTGSRLGSKGLSWPGNSFVSKSMKLLDTAANRAPLFSHHHRQEGCGR